MFRDGWTDNADVMSYLYTGTPALKTDFTRTGKRTIKGAIADGVNSVTRFYINNFTDGYYHDCLDIATQQLNCTSPLRKRPWFTSMQISLVMTFIFTFIVKLVVEGWILSDASYTMKQSILYTFIVGGTMFSGINYIIQNGRNFTDDSTRYV